MNRYKLKDLSLSKLEYGSGAAASEYDGVTRYVRITDIDDDGNLGHDIVSPNLVEDKYLLNEGDVVFARTGATVGKTFRYRESDGRCIYAGFLIRVVPNQELIRPDYLYFFTKSPQYRQFVQSSMKVVAQPNINAKQYGDLEFNVPDLNTQDEIVFNLLALSHIVELRKRELSVLDDLIKARFVELFGNPIYNTNKLPIKRLNDVGDWASGGTPSRTVPEYFEGEINWYSAGELNTLFLQGSVEKITEEAIEKSSAKLFKAGSMLVGMYDTAAFKMGILKEDSASNQACACITPNDEVNIIWLYYELQLMKDHFLSQRRGVRQKNLNLGMIKGFEIPIANRDKQDEFVNFVKQVDKSKVAIQKALDETQLMFDSLMQQYFG